MWVCYWFDYYDELFGGLYDGCSVCLMLFDVVVLGLWQVKLCCSYFGIYLVLYEELFVLMMIWQLFKVKLIVVRVVLCKMVVVLWCVDLVGVGVVLQGQMLKVCSDQGVMICIDSFVIELIVKDQVMMGVVVESGGEVWCIGVCLGVLVNVGGFVCNQVMCDKYQLGICVDWLLIGLGDIGEMIEEMMCYGVWIVQMDEMVGLQ